MGGGPLATPGTLPNVHCYSLLPHVLYIYNIAHYCLMCSAWSEPPRQNTLYTLYKVSTVHCDVNSPSAIIGLLLSPLLPFIQSVLL